MPITPKIALIQSWPNLPVSAEHEFIARLTTCMTKLGVTVAHAVTSDDLLEADVDFAIAIHEFTPKLTRIPTLGAMWSPPTFYWNDDYRIRSVMSYDGYLVGSDLVRSYLKDLWFSTGTSKPSSSFLFLPSSGISDIAARELNRLFYVGVHWDGKRHNVLIDYLASKGAVDVYGPAASWQHLQTGYCGAIPFDGASLFHALARSGIVLALHKKAHREANTPSMRLFEAASVGCAIITDDIPFAREHFGDTIHIVRSLEPRDQADEILTILEAIKANPLRERERAQEARLIFERNWSLDVMVPKVLAFAQDVLSREAYRPLPNDDYSHQHSQPDCPLVSIVVRTGGRELCFLDRCIQSILNQSYRPIELVVVDYKSRDDIRDFCAGFSESLAPSSSLTLNYIRCADTGYRSSSLLLGLGAATGVYVGVQDDDDTMHPNHVANLVRYAERHRAPFVYSGVIRYEETGSFFEAPNFAGPLGVKIAERRQLHFFDPYDKDRLMKLDNFIQSNCWLCLRDVLFEATQGWDDPFLKVGEDMYLYLLLSRFVDFRFNYRATAEWSWRSRDGDNSMLNVAPEEWKAALEKVHRRLRFLYPGARIGRTVFVDEEATTGDEDRTLNHQLQHGHVIKIDNSFLEYAAAKNFHAADFRGGAWTCTTSASLELRAHPTLRGRCRILIHSQAAFDATAGDQRVVFSVRGHGDCSLPVTAWTPMVASVDIDFGLSTHVTLNIMCQYTVNPLAKGWNADKRDLGVHITHIECAALGADGDAE